MTTPRTIKASEVRKGMRVSISTVSHDVTTTVAGQVCQATHSANTAVVFEDGTSRILSSFDPVDLLDEPEPEWVEGAWYWCEFNGRHRRPMYRTDKDWAAFEGSTGMRYEDDEITVLGRVLIVDWPGDEYASKLVETYGAGLTWDDFECSPLQKVADAIRTQGGVR